MVAENGGILLECDVLTNTVTTCLDSIVHMEISFKWKFASWKQTILQPKKLDLVSDVCLVMLYETKRGIRDNPSVLGFCDTQQL